MRELDRDEDVAAIELVRDLTELACDLTELACDIADEAASDVGVLLITSLLDGLFDMGSGSGCMSPEAPQAVKKLITKTMAINLLIMMDTVIHLRVLRKYNCINLYLAGYENYVWILQDFVYIFRLVHHKCD